ncbi:EamA family transporter RarD [Aurantiacibacter sp. MUD11]|uniref:EamA family transporter RarD n=1 Tax=Aurantiacibacter sp. MUD11 TaxID=3003265 RepID=UPI0022AB0B79|nr:EamA family transporter RarD [Aurantiacibacter sp. MUD11]WAT17843.1 EamA family transporter RarD [Aurantiacibacter sp. MUD11]
MTEESVSQRRALLCALATHAIWGGLPLYLILVDEVPPLEFVAWRTLFTLPVCLLFLWRFGQFAEVRRTVKDRRTLRTLLASSCMIAINWFLYVWAIQTHHVYAASLGYYILPLVMMVLGMLFLGERLSRWQQAAVVMAAIGVAALAAGALTTLWVSLTLAITFGIYGLLRKTVNAGPLVGLTIEGTILLPLVAGYLTWEGVSGNGITLGRELVESLAIVFSGALTAIPLILFATATRALPYTVIGFLQFLSPTAIFILGLTVFGEDLKPAQLICFVLIWLAIALFTWDMWRGARRTAKNVVPT